LLQAPLFNKQELDLAKFWAVVQLQGGSEQVRPSVRLAS
jgi:hypothetical protein